MRSILRIATASMARRSRSTLAETYDVVCDDDLSSWEMVNDSLSDDDVCSFYGDEAMSEDATFSTEVNEVICDEPESEIEKEEEEDACVSRDSVPPADVTFVLPFLYPPPMYLPVEATRHHSDDDDDVHYEEDVYDYDDDDVDEELVLCKFKKRFGKQRIKKMGKSGGRKLNKSKNMPYYYNRPGCLNGKHGVGGQHAIFRRGKVGKSGGGSWGSSI